MIYFLIKNAFEGLEMKAEFSEFEPTQETLDACLNSYTLTQ